MYNIRQRCFTHTYVQPSVMKWEADSFSTYFVLNTDTATRCLNYNQLYHKRTINNVFLFTAKHTKGQCYDVTLIVEYERTSTRCCA